MGFSAQVQNNQTSGNGMQPFQQVAQPNPLPKDGSAGHQPEESNGMPQGKGGSQGTFTYSPTSGQQRMGGPNPYPNTVGIGDNQGNQPMPQLGKGKGQ